jgi:hypothetical protein
LLLLPPSPSHYSPCWFSFSSLSASFSLASRVKTHETLGMHAREKLLSFLSLSFLAPSTDSSPYFYYQRGTSTQKAWLSGRNTQNVSSLSHQQGLGSQPSPCSTNWT